MIKSTCPKCGMVYEADHPVQCPCLADETAAISEVRISGVPFEPFVDPLHYYYPIPGGTAAPHPFIRWETTC